MSLRNRFLSPPFLIAFITVSVAAVRTFTAAAEPDAAQHGPVEMLQQKLVQSGGLERLLTIAARQIETGQRDPAFRTIRHILTQPEDSFTTVSDDSAAGSVQRAAIQILLKADFATRREWIATYETLATRELQQALVDHDFAALRVVSQTFPLTQSGLQSLSLQFLAAIDTAQFRLAEQLLAEIENSYVRIRLPYSAVSAIAELQPELDRARAALMSDGSANISDQPVGTPYPTSSPGLSQPWTEPLWMWREPVWQHPAAAGLLSAIADDSQIELLSVNAWQSLLVKDRLLFRTPLRIICFDRLSGKVQWSLPTDTGATLETIVKSPQRMLLRTPVNAETLLQIERFGTLVADPQFLFFIDHFRPFGAVSGETPTSQIVLPGPLAGRFGNRLSLSEDAAAQSGGSRLVAVRLSPTPQIAWTIGGDDSFTYDLTASIASQPQIRSTTPTSNAGDPSPLSQDAFRQHRFLGVPLIHDRSLFVMTSDGEQVFLNAISRSSARLQWRQSLTFDDFATIPLGRVQIRNGRSVGESALCGVIGDSIICSLPDGILIAASRIDGRLQWATDTSEPQVEYVSSLRSSQRNQSRNASIPFHPVICKSRILWAAPDSNLLTCVDAFTGAIQWQVSRKSSGGAAVSGSDDAYAAGCTQDAVILIGPRHIRAVEVESGLQIWATAIPPQTGRAVCNGRLCLIPQRSGSIGTVDLKTGRRDTLPQIISHDAGMQVSGSLTADDDIICAATPVQITVIPSAESVRKRLRGLAASEQPDIAALTSRARAELLSGHRPAGLRGLLELSRNDHAAVAAEAVLADYLLHLLAANQFEDRPLNADGDLPAELSTRSQILETLNRLKLSREQSLRRFVLAPDQLKVPPEISDDASESTTLRLLPDWHVRADAAAWAMLSFKQAKSLTGFAASPRSGVRAAEHGISFPSHVGTAPQQLDFADTLIQQHRWAAAELFLLAAQQYAATDESTLFQERLRQLRKSVDGHAASVPETLREQSTSIVQVSIRETLLETIDHYLLKTLATGFRSQVDVPSWYQRGLLAIRKTDGLRLSAFDMHTGSVTDEVPLPLPIATVNHPVDSVNCPGLLPLTDMNQLGMMSLVGPDGPQLLWHKRIDSENGQVSGILAGPIGPSYFIWKTDTQLNCSHPLTGRLLWSRNLITAPQTSTVFGKSLLMTGDELAVVVFGEGLQTYQLFRTQDGRHLGDGRLDIPSAQTPLPIGRRLLYTDSDRRIRLLDLLTQQDALTTDKPLRLTEHGRASVLTNGRVLTVTEDHELLVINGENATVELLCPLPVELTDQPFTGLLAFERNGRLFILMRNYRHSDASISATPLLQEPRLDFGTLLCLDQETHKLLWTRSGQPAVVPPIYGDPTDLMLLWSVVDPSSLNRPRPNGGFFGDDTRRTRFGRERSLTLEIINGRTGQSVAEQSGLSAHIPLRCVHDSASRQIRVETEQSVITVDYESVAND